MLTGSRSSQTFASAGVQLVVFLRWLHRCMRDDVREVVCNDVANKLAVDRIDEALHKIAHQQGILLKLPPNVHFMDFDDGSGKGNT